ncbi:hypothetical protein EDB89DRAFT_215892 [Lactarius sanguifluus]|nr:hypothetical protein EDB89DRAFT_215892 [Lactarius sanguifluus]
MITSSLTRLCGNIFWDPYGLKSSFRRTQCRTQPFPNVSVGRDTPLERKDTCRTVSTPSMQSLAQSGVGPHSERPSLRRVTRRIPLETGLLPRSPHKSMTPSMPWTPIRSDAIFLQAPRNMYLDPPAPETHPLRPMSSATSRAPPQLVSAGPYPLSPGESNGCAVGTPTERGEESEASVLERRSPYGQQKNSSAARGIWLEQQVTQREAEARLKEEAARGLEMAARMAAFAWVQSLEACAGRIHDAAMQAEARAHLQDAETWESRAEMLRQQAETAKREAELAKQEIAVRRAKREVRHKDRRARRKEAELSLKEDTVQNKRKEALRMEGVHWRKTVIKQSEERLSKRRAAKDRMVTKGTVASAWGKLKRLISRDPHVRKPNLTRILQYKNSVFNGNVTGVGLGSSSDADVDPETSTWVPIPRSRIMEQRQSTITIALGEDQQEPRSMSRVVASVHTTSSSGISLQYTVKSVHSYKERMNRSAGGYYRHRHIKPETKTRSSSKTTVESTRLGTLIG